MRNRLNASKLYMHSVTKAVKSGRAWMNTFKLTGNEENEPYFGLFNDDVEPAHLIEVDFISQMAIAHKAESEKASC